MTEPPPQAEVPTRENRENQLRFIVGVIGRYWVLLLVLPLAGSLICGAIGFFSATESAPLLYKASMELSIRQSSWKTDGAANESQTSLLPVTPSDVLKRISKQFVVEAIADTFVTKQKPGAPKATEDEADREKALAIAKLDQALDLGEVANTANILVSATAPMKQEAIRLANLAADVVVERNQELLSAEIEEATAFHLAELSALRESIEAAEAAQWDFLREKGFRTYEEVTAQLRKESEDRIESQATKATILAQLADIEAKLRENHETLPLSLSQITDSLITKLLDELEALRKEELALDMVYTSEYAPLQELREEISEKEHTVLEAVRRYEAGTGAGADMWENRQNLRREHTQLQLDLAKHEARTASLQEHIGELFDKLPEFASNSHEYNQIFREVEGFRSQHSKMLDRDFQLRTAVRAGAGQLRRLTPATASMLHPRRIRYTVNFIVGAVVGLLIAFSLGIMLDMMDTSIRNADDVATHLERTVIGTIPKMSFANGRKHPKRRKRAEAPSPEHKDIAPCIVTLHDPKSPVSEAYRILRTNFQFASLQQQPRTLMVTSAVPGEGKTTTAINLAVAMAASGSRVLLLDVDLRRPSVHRMLNIKRTPGLAEVLADNADIHEVMQPTDVENLLVVSSGQLPPNPSELIGSDRMHQLTTQLGQEFDIVICDAPSIIVVTDPILLATHVDSTLVLVSVNNARRETIRRALGLLDGVQAHVAGIVLNGIEPTRRRYYYYYYYSDDKPDKQRRRWYHA